eukprot:scaffold3464_cov406-Prasinococcus_capsulatus_cf.AAC.15
MTDLARCVDRLLLLVPRGLGSVAQSREEKIARFRRERDLTQRIQELERRWQWAESKSRRGTAQLHNCLHVPLYWSVPEYPRRGCMDGDAGITKGGQGTAEAKEDEEDAEEHSCSMLEESERNSTVWDEELERELWMKHLERAVNKAMNELSIMQRELRILGNKEQYTEDDRRMRQQQQQAFHAQHRHTDRRTSANFPQRSRQDALIPQGKALRLPCDRDVWPPWSRHIPDLEPEMTACFAR